MTDPFMTKCSLGQQRTCFNDATPRSYAQPRADERDISQIEDLGAVGGLGSIVRVWGGGLRTWTNPLFELPAPPVPGEVDGDCMAWDDKAGREPHFFGIDVTKTPSHRIRI